MIRVLLIIEMPNPSDEGRVATLYCPVYCLMLRSERGKDFVRVIFHDIIVDRIAFWAALGSGLNVNIRHDFLTVREARTLPKREQGALFPNHLGLCSVGT